MKILVTGGAGYVGSILTPRLLEIGHHVDVIDLFWFGDYLPEHPNLKKIKADVRGVKQYNPERYDVIFHFASVANDPCTNLDPALSWEISCESSYAIADAIARANTETRVIYASSGSVYGIKTEERVTEELELVPISVYNKAKIVSERIFESFKNKIPLQIVRPATVCGFAPRMRLDVAVNLLTMQALKNMEINVLGGDQFRPNIHILDLVNFYVFLLERPDITGTFNAGFENITILSLAKRISHATGAIIQIAPSNDPRSYRIDSSKALALGFSPKFNVDYAIGEIVRNYKDRTLKDREEFYNVNWMRLLMAEGSIK